MRIVRILISAVLAALAAPAFAAPPVYLCLFTHIEDNTPGGTLGSTQSRNNYLLYRDRLISMGTLARDSSVAWSLQPDWKFLEAALLYEDATLVQTTNGKNLLRYLREDLGVHIDPHSHENGGYDYTDVAHLLDSLGVGGSTVIGGHVWDPSLPQFQEWDRFRVPVQGEHYPDAWWRGDILMGSGTPNHVNDPVVSGVWRPRDRDHYFENDSTANIVAIGQFQGTVNDVRMLEALYESGEVSPDFMLTTSYPVKPSTLTRADGIASVRDSVVAPLVALRDSGMVMITDFTSLVQAWLTDFGGRGFLYDANAVAGVNAPGPPPASILASCSPNPFASSMELLYSLTCPARVRVAIFDVRGREIARLADQSVASGRHAMRWDARQWPDGIYFCRLECLGTDGRDDRAVVTRKLVKLH